MNGIVKRGLPPSIFLLCVRHLPYDDLFGQPKHVVVYNKRYMLDLYSCVWLDNKHLINPLTPNDHYRGCAAPLTSKRCILYIYSTSIGTEYFKHGIYAQFLSLQNAVCFIILTYLVPVLFTFYIQSVLKLKKIILAPSG